MRIERKAGFPRAGEPGLFWLGQAGFWIETGEHRILIDPYLSDSLARKYAGKKHEHKRMMPPPVAVEKLPRPDLVLITHGHTDHMDPDTLRPLHSRFPDLPFVVPKAKLELARKRIGDSALLIGADAGDELAPLPALKLQIFPAAHEKVERDALGQFVFLGYGLATRGMRIYHSGDCIPFDGQADLIGDFAPDIALLPVNGRDAQRLADGIPGNFSLKEAIDLSENIPYLVPHHFGMFDFNTIDPAEIDKAAQTIARPKIVRPQPGEILRIL